MLTRENLQIGITMVFILSCQFPPVHNITFSETRAPAVLAFQRCTYGAHRIE